ncbi:MAG: LysR family transcriptional regulator, partial [Pseudomonadota bacterium]
MLSTKRLRAFALVVEQGSLAAAARAMHMSEPAVSRQIAALEAELKMPLFSRDQRQLIPTEEGQAFYAQSKWTLQSINRLPEVAAQIRDGALHSLRFISMPRLANAIAAPAIVRFRESHPDIRLNVEVHSRQFLENWVAGQRFDIGLGTLPTEHPEVVTETVFEMPCCAILPVNHAKADAKSVRLKDLADTPYVALPKISLVQDQARQIMERDGVTLQTTIVVSQTTLACELVARGVGFTICDPLVADAFRDRVRVIPLRPQ